MVSLNFTNQFIHHLSNLANVVEFNIRGHPAVVYNFRICIIMLLKERMPQHFLNRYALAGVKSKTLLDQVQVV
jgi:hypothetical protein